MSPRSQDEKASLLAELVQSVDQDELASLLQNALIVNRQAPAGCIKIKVKTMAGQVLQLAVRGSDTIDDIKASIEEAEGTPVKLQRLIYAGKQLNDGGATVRSCNIQKAHTLHLVVRSMGG